MTRGTRFKKFKKRLGANSPGLTVAVIALILALTGGALAASGALTGKQKKEVEKISKKFAGKPGASGAQGPAGTPGANGTNGKDGTSGKNGADGNSVTGTPIASGGACGPVTGVKYTLNAVSNNVCNGTNGTNGTNGQDAGFNYLFNADTAESDPGTGKLKLNNAAPGSATVLDISETDNNASKIDAVIAGWVSGPGTKGTLMIRKAGAPGTFAQYTIKGTNVEEGTYDKITIVFVAGSGSFANNDPITVAYSASGTEVLPSGAIETGTWAFTGTEADKAGIRVPLSFAIRAPELTAEQVHFKYDEDFETFCKGSVENPRPAPGVGALCVYDSVFAPFEGTTFDGIFNPSHVVASGEEEGAGRAGAVLLFAPPTGLASGSGTFAVRAP